MSLFPVIPDFEIEILSRLAADTCDLPDVQPTPLPTDEAIQSAFHLHLLPPPYQLNHVLLRIQLAPSYIGKERQGILDTLEPYRYNYLPQLKGVLLQHDNMRLLDDGLAKVLYDSPYISLKVKMTMLSFSPMVGQRLAGVVHGSFPDHLGLHVLGTFNAHVALEHLPENIVWSPYEHCFTLCDENGTYMRSISEGDIVLFTVREIETQDGLISISGEMKRHGTGHIAKEDL